MSDNEGTAAQGPREDEQRLESEIQKEINKLKYFLEETDDLIQIKDYTEMEIVTKRADKIVDTLSDLISHAEELKIDSGASSRSVRQWKKDIKSSYAALIADKERLSKTLKTDKRRSESNSSGGNWNRNENSSKRKSDKRPSFVREREIMNGKCGRRNSRQS